MRKRHAKWPSGHLSPRVAPCLRGRSLRFSASLEHLGSACDVPAADTAFDAARFLRPATFAQSVAPLMILTETKERQEADKTTKEL